MKLFATLILIILAPSVFAQGTPLFYWDNQDGLVEAKGCGTVRVPTNRFRFSKYFGKGTQVTENLRNFNGVRQSHLINSSLVKLIEGERKKDYKKIEVVGVNQMKGVKANRWFSERLDRNYLYEKSLVPAEDYIMLLQGYAPDVPIGDLRDSTLGTMWHIAAEGDYFKLVCGEFTSGRDYIIFRVYAPEKLDAPIALVAVYWDETKIFRSFEALSKARAYKVIPTVLDPIRVDDLLRDNPDYLGDLSDMADPNEVIADEVSREEEAPTVVEIDEEQTAEENEPGEDETNVIEGGHENVVCIGSDTLNVRNVDLDKVLFSAQRGEKVKIFQGFDGETKQTKEIGGVEYTFIKVQFADREESDETEGWVAESFVQPKSTCKHVNNNTFVRDRTAKITSIDDPACCEFPTVKRPTHAYTSGMRRFAAGRSKGKRLHAACDLYRYKNEPALAIGPGKVIRGKYYYYQGTYAIQVRHDGGHIVVYGEITGKNPKGVVQGARVKMGDRVGYIGKVNSNCCRPMLHFELYSGEGKGPLRVVGKNKFQRRSDLMDPTQYLLKWEDGKF